MYRPILDLYGYESGLLYPHPCPWGSHRSRTTVAEPKEWGFALLNEVRRPFFNVSHLMQCTVDSIQLGSHPAITLLCPLPRLGPAAQQYSGYLAIATSANFLGNQPHPNHKPVPAVIPLKLVWDIVSQEHRAATFKLQRDSDVKTASSIEWERFSSWGSAATGLHKLAGGLARITPVIFHSPSLFPDVSAPTGVSSASRLAHEFGGCSQQVCKACSCPA